MRHFEARLCSVGIFLSEQVDTFLFSRFKRTKNRRNGERPHEDATGGRVGAAPEGEQRPGQIVCCCLFLNGIDLKATRAPVLVLQRLFVVLFIGHFMVELWSY